MRILHSKRGRVALGIVAAMATAGGALAYFTTTGSGTGAATVGASSALTIHGASASTLYPGTSSTVSFTVDNPSPGKQQVGTIHLASIKACPAGDSWTGSACSNSGTEITTCESIETGASDTTTANFWMPDVVAAQQVNSGNGQSVTATGTLTMNNLNASQNTCQNANLTLNLTS
ncbi:MAG TPA: hypothetical protein VG325_00655 [Solirubrobacteraceae bacterium]|jgi:hypothetical protein|nr:hypothetical protein [Solirubrobacteraceae bacterium]